MTEEEIKKLKDFKVYVFEWEVYVKAEDFKEIAIENKKLKEELEWYKTEHERLVDKLVIKWATELLDRKFENKKWWQWK
jgi:hypothetical protein